MWPHADTFCVYFAQLETHTSVFFNLDNQVKTQKGPCSSILACVCSDENNCLVGWWEDMWWQIRRKLDLNRDSAVGAARRPRPSHVISRDCLQFQEIKREGGFLTALPWKLKHFNQTSWHWGISKHGFWHHFSCAWSFPDLYPKDKICGVLLKFQMHSPAIHNQPLNWEVTPHWRSQLLLRCMQPQFFFDAKLKLDSFHLFLTIYFCTPSFFDTHSFFQLNFLIWVRIANIFRLPFPPCFSCNCLTWILQLCLCGQSCASRWFVAILFVY